MKISIRTRDFKWTPTLRTHLERNIEFALARYRSQVSYISVYLADLNGPKGGLDKLCQITANLRGCSKPIVILEKSTEILAAAYRAMRRLGIRIGGSIRRRNRPVARRFRATIRHTAS